MGLWDEIKEDFDKVLHVANPIQWFDDSFHKQPLPSIGKVMKGPNGDPVIHTGQPVTTIRGSTKDPGSGSTVPVVKPSTMQKIVPSTANLTKPAADDTQKWWIIGGSVAAAGAILLLIVFA
jgi:hypothetical protein